MLIAYMIIATLVYWRLSYMSRCVLETATTTQILQWGPLVAIGWAPVTLFMVMVVFVTLIEEPYKG